MPEQGLLFGHLPYEIQRDCAAEIARFAGQVEMIFDRLLRGPATNRELSGIALKYTGRISRLRKLLRPKDYGVEAFDHNHATGVCWYRLVRIGEDGEPLL